MFVFSAIKQWLYVGAVFIVAIAVAYLKGVSVAEERNKLRQYQNYQKTRRKIDEAPTYYEPSDAARFLHERIRERNLRRTEETD